MKNLILSLSLLFLLISCLNKEEKKVITTPPIKQEKKDTVFLQPLGKVDEKYITTIVNGVEKFYGTKVVVLNNVKLTDDLLTDSKLRYSAPKILDKFHSNKNKLVITQVDIATPDPRSPEWGIFGLGECPGTTCTVSTFRIRRNASDSLIFARLVKICLHEIGHNYGLNHCERDENCMMTSAHGTIKQVDNEKLYFCDYCMNFIKNKQKK